MDLSNEVFPEDTEPTQSADIMFYNLSMPSKYIKVTNLSQVALGTTSEISFRTLWLSVVLISNFDNRPLTSESFTNVQSQLSKITPQTSVGNVHV